MARSGIRQRLFRTRAEDDLPMRIEHQRIYILPTMRGCAFLGALLLMLVATVNYSLGLGYALCFLLTGMFSATLLHTYRNLAGIELRRIESEPAFAGETLRFAPLLANPGGPPRRGIRLRTATGTVAAADLEPEGERHVALAVRGERRGPQPLGRLTLESDWPLGLWKAWSYVHAPCNALVYPRPESDPPPLPAEPDGERQGGGAAGGVRGDVAGLRPYVPGDVPSTIAWKSVARGQGLHVRTFDDERGPSRTRLTLAAAALPALEEQLSRLSAWVLAAEARGTDYALELPSTSLAASRGDVQRHEALGALALHGHPGASAP